MTRLLVIAVLLTACVTEKRKTGAAAHVDLGAAYLLEGNPEGAITELEHAAKLNPQNVDAWHKLALAYMARGALPESERAFKKATRLSPDSAEILNNYGLLLLQLNRRGEAIATFEKAKKDLTYRKPAILMNNLGYAYYLDADYENALANLNGALERLPNLCQARFHRGLVWEAKGDHDRALADLDQVIKECGDNAPGAYFHAAKVLLAQGKRDAASVYLHTVLDMAKDDPALSDAAQALLTQEAL